MWIVTLFDFYREKAIWYNKVLYIAQKDSFVHKKILWLMCFSYCYGKSR